MREGKKRERRREGGREGRKKGREEEREEGEKEGRTEEGRQRDCHRLFTMTRMTNRESEMNLSQSSEQTESPVSSYQCRAARMTHRPVVILTRQPLGVFRG